MQTRAQIDLDNQWAATGYEELGISFDHTQAPDTLRRFLDGETSDKRAQAQNEKAAGEWEEKAAAARAAVKAEAIAAWLGIAVIALGILAILYL
jgi:Arc/MetJ family transcription regulator